MIRWNVGTKIGVGFGLALVFIGMIGFVFYRSTIKLAESADAIARTHLVLTGIDALIGGINDAEIGERGYIIAGEEKYLELFHSGQTMTGERIKTLRDLTRDNSEQERRVIALEPMIQAKMIELQDAIDSRRDKSKGFELAQQAFMSGKGKNTLDDIRRLAEEIRGEEYRLLKTRSDDAKIIEDSANLHVIFGTASALLVFTLTALLIARNLRHLTTDISESINIVGAAANDISTSTAQLAASAGDSAQAVNETTTTVEEVRLTAEIASLKAKNVSEIAQKAALISQSGRKSTEDVVAAMNRIRQQMDAIAASVGKLSEQSDAIGLIIATVEVLAAQSNLLAVNAAIEAAKAGEHGKGFGVVAQEVKSLAEQSRQATNQVRSILSDIQKATTAAVMSIEQGSKAVEAGMRQTEVAGESIYGLAGTVSESAQAATQIATSSQQQLIGVGQVAGAMESIKQASNRNVANTVQLDLAARNLSVLGQKLKQMVAQYSI